MKYGVVRASAILLVMFVLSWFKTKSVDLLLAIGTVNFDIPFESIRGFTAMDDSGLKSPSTSETDAG